MLFSLLNLIVHWKMLRKFRQDVRSDSPMYYVWHVFCAVRMPIISISADFHPEFLCFLDLHQWLDVFDNIPHARFSTHRTP